jgi:hypothetical protein
MHFRHATLVSLALAVALLCTLLFAQGGEEKTAAPPPNTLDTRLLWNFYWQGTKRKNDVLELLDPKEARGRSLVITHLETRASASMRYQVIQHRRLAVQPGAKPAWKKEVRRGDAFSSTFITASTEWAGATYDSFTGMVFEKDTRPALEITLGNGDLWVYAEGYWSGP